MVHGGGHHSGGGGLGGGHHHRHHRPGTTNRWRGTENRNNLQQQTVIVNNVDGSGNCYLPRSSGYTTGRHSQENDCRCCQDACCGSVRLARATKSSYAFLFLFLFFILWCFSNVNETWTLNPGETRQLHTNMVGKALTTELHLRANVPDGIALYEYQNGCPALTGPIVSLEETNNLMDLAEGDYQYDYFYLNQNSVLNVTVLQHTGASNIFILQGTIPSDDNDNTFAMRAILQRYVGIGQTQNVQYTVPSSDTYTVVYDNASNRPGTLTASYHVDLTSFDVSKDMKMSCELSTQCSVRTSKCSCIIVQATKDLVTIHVMADRNWSMIGIWTILPVILTMLCCRKKEEQHEYENLPPATNPAANNSGGISGPLPLEPKVMHVLPVPTKHDVLPVAIPVEGEVLQWPVATAVPMNDERV